MQNSTFIRFQTAELTEYRDHVAEGEGEADAQVTQLSSGVPHIELSRFQVSDAVISLHRSSEDLAVSWQTDADSIYLSLQLGSGGLHLEGRERSANSVVVYSNPGRGAWAAKRTRIASPAHGSVDIRLPRAAAETLGLSAQLLQRGWFELPVPQELAEELLHWCGRQLETGPGPDTRAQLYWTLDRLLSPLRLGPSPSLEAPTHYTRLVTLSDEQLALVPRGTALNVAELADELRVSVRTLQRAFRAVYKIGISRYIQHQRLALSRRLIMRSGESVANASYLAGFRHPSRFAAHFQRLYGRFPSAARRTLATAPRPTLANG